MFKKFMSKKRNKKRGFTLIELIIVIAIIAILAAIAVPAFGQIRQKANESADLGNARTMFSVVSTAIASDEIKLPAFTSGTTTEKVMYYPVTKVGEGTITTGTGGTPVTETGAINVALRVTESTVKQYPDAAFVISLDSNGDIAVGYVTDNTKINAATASKPDTYVFVYGDESHK